MIFIKEVLKSNIDEYWALHWEYLNRDIFPYVTLGAPLTIEDYEYFRSPNYRGVMEKYMDRLPDQAHFVYFYQDESRIGCAQYVTYKSEDGKCFLMDFWVFPEYRGNKTGHKCYTALKDYVKNDGATYIQINVSNQRNRNFWLSIGFIDDDLDEWEQPLMKLNI